MFDIQAARKQCEAIGNTATEKAVLEFAAYARVYFPAALDALEEAHRAIESAIDDDWGLASLGELRALVGRELGERE